MRLLLVIIITAANVLADSTPGLAVLAAKGKRFPCNRVDSFFQNTDKAFIAASWDTFGESRRCIEQLADVAEDVTISFYFSNEVCRRKRNCYRHEFKPRLQVRQYNSRLERKRKRLIKSVERRAKTIREYCDFELKGVECLLVAGLESQFTPEALAAWVEAALAAGWRRGEIVHNPVEGSSFRGVGAAGLLEYHNGDSAHWVRYSPGVDPSRFIFTFDGARLDLCRADGRFSLDSISDADVRAAWQHYRGRSRFFAAWCPEWQGLRGDSRTAPNPRRRRFTVSQSSLDSFWEIVRD